MMEIPDGFIPHDRGPRPEGIHDLARVSVKSKREDGHIEEWGGGAFWFRWDLVDCYRVWVA